MLEIIIENYKPIGKILLYTLIFIIAIIIIFYKNVKEEIANNWEKYRDKPYILPFAGFIKKEKNQSVFEATKSNFIKVTFNLVNKIFDTFMKPVYPIIKMIMNTFKYFMNILNTLRNQITVIRNFLFKLFEKMYIRLQNSLAAIIFFFLKLRESMKRSYGILTLLVYTIEHSYIFFESLMKSPLTKFGGMAEKVGLGMSLFTFGPAGINMWHNALCFGPDTIIKFNGKEDKIDNININDMLQDENRVLAKITILNVTNLYKFNNIFVSGDHLVFYKNKYQRISDIPISIKVKDDSVNKLICLITSKEIINIDGYIFKDYLDTHDRNINKLIRRILYEYLNPGVCNEANLKCNDLFSGISQDISINNTDIIGNIEISPGQLDMYEIDGIELSGNILLFRNNLWQRVSSLKTAKYIGKNVRKCIHYITKNNIVKINNILIRDFCETNNKKINFLIDDIVNNHINNQ